MSLAANTLEGLFTALFGDGSMLYLENGKWTFDAIPNFPKLPNEGIFEYVFRLLQSGNVLYNYGVWNATSTYPVGALVAYNNQYWVSKVSNINSAPTISNANWSGLLYTLEGLKGDSGTNGTPSFVIGQ
jgi:hypothetical protein